MNKKALIIFLKYPEIGKVKTRLAKDFNEVVATEFYRHCVEKIINELKENIRLEASIYLFCSEDRNIPNIKNWLGNDLKYKAQAGKDLGERMKNAFIEVFMLGYQQAIIIGTDIPDLNSEIIINAFKLLNNFDSVVGPSKDGGYYLLGIKKNHPEIFDGLNWSTGEVLSETIKKLNSKKISNTLLQELIDVDTAKNLNEWMELQPNNSLNSVFDYVDHYLNGGENSIRYN